MWLDKNPDNPDGFSDKRVATLLDIVTNCAAEFFIWGFHCVEFC